MLKMFMKQWCLDYLAEVGGHHPLCRCGCFQWKQNQDAIDTTLNVFRSAYGPNCIDLHPIVCRPDRHCEQCEAKTAQVARFKKKYLGGSL